MNFGFTNPWLLTLLPIGLVPLLFSRHKVVEFSHIALVPSDRASGLTDVALRAAGAVAMISLVVGIAGPFQAARSVERVGQGAQMVLLVDRSRSMDEPFYSQATGLPALASGHKESKGEVARGLLSQFVGRRANDLFAMVVFSTYPIQTLAWTDKGEAVQAAISAGNVGRGLAETNLGFGLERAIRLFEDRPFAGSRIILLVSDGAATLDWVTQQRIEQLLRQYRVALYWIYLRTRNSPSIFEETSEDASNGIAPQQALHRFFSEMDAPYRAYTAEDPRALERAIHDVSRLQTLPIHYQEIRPRRSLEGSFYAVALLMMSLLVVAKLLEIRTWS